jgi:hypothetical protein
LKSNEQHKSPQFLKTLKNIRFILMGYGDLIDNNPRMLMGQKSVGWGRG